MILLHHNGTSSQYAKHDPDHANSPAVQEYRDQLVSMGLLEVGEPSPRDPVTFNITEKGRAYIQLLLATPMPVNVWMHPAHVPNTMGAAQGREYPDTQKEADPFDKLFSEIGSMGSINRGPRSRPGRMSFDEFLLRLMRG